MTPGLLGLLAREAALMAVDWLKRRAAARQWAQTAHRPWGCTVCKTLNYMGEQGCKACGSARIR